jgi:hypothetical protein
MNNVSGLYKVDSLLFSSKFEAFTYATKHDKKVEFYYFDEIWEKELETYVHDKSINLLELYRQRALQIREKYNYLVLHFSGGSDSTTILEAFINNGIKLDEIYVKWPMKFVGTDKYVANKDDKSATNMLSEWDFSIKPKLDYIRNNHPEIKIVLEDWTDNLKNVNITSDILLQQNHNFGLPNFAFSETVSDTSLSVESKGTSVAHIIGIDKPNLSYVNGKFSMIFTDVTLMCSGYQHAYSKTNTQNKVYFFYAPDFPKLTIAMAYAAAYELTKYPAFLPIMDSRIMKTYDTDKRTLIHDIYEKLIIPGIYPTWNMKTFQVAKPNNFNKLYHPWFHYVFNQYEFVNTEKKIASLVNEMSMGISDKLKIKNESGNTVALALVFSKSFDMKVKMYEN